MISHIQHVSYGIADTPLTCGSATLAATSLLRKSYTCSAVVVTALGSMLVVTDAR